MAQTLQMLSIISFTVAGVCLVLAIFFCFFFKIPSVIGDLSGRTARKSIAKMRATNEKTGTKSYKQSKTNAERGKLTGTMPDFGKFNKKNEAPENDKPETGLLEDNKADGVDSEEIGVFESEATGLLIDENATAPLDVPAHNPIVHTGGKKLEIIEEVILVHTEEVIG